jgi:hypothetical protein
MHTCTTCVLYLYYTQDVHCVYRSYVCMSCMFTGSVCIHRYYSSSTRILCVHTCTHTCSMYMYMYVCTRMWCGTLPCIVVFFFALRRISTLFFVVINVFINVATFKFLVAESSATPTTHNLYFLHHLFFLFLLWDFQILLMHIVQTILMMFLQTDRII